MSTKVTIRKVAGGADWGRGYVVKVGNDYLAELSAIADAARKGTGLKRTDDLKADIKVARVFTMIRAAAAACQVAHRRGLDVTPFVGKLAAGAESVIAATDRAAEDLRALRKESDAIEGQFIAANKALEALGQAPVPEEVKTERLGALVTKIARAEEALKAARSAENEMNKKAAAAISYLRNIRNGEAD